MKNVNLLLYLNLAGEVFYIIVHRMKSQKVKEEHQERVKNDIAVAICHTTVIQNLLKGSLQILNLKLADVRILMDRIVHSSIMTVNAFSMEKLFELTLIATKYQYSTCQFPSDILLIAMNHLDTIRKSVTDNTAKTFSENLHNLLVDRFKDVDIRTMQTYRYLVLSYLADVKLKMTNLIRLGLQKTTGEFVKELPDKNKRPELHQPGLIEVFKCPDEDETEVETTCTSFACSTQSSCHCDEFDREEVIEKITDIDTEDGGSKKSLQVHESASRGKEVLTTRFKVEDPEAESYPVLKTSLALNGDRGVSLGLSIYDIPGNCEEAPTNVDESVDESSKEGEEQTDIEGGLGSEYQIRSKSDLYATRGLDLCSVLLGCDSNDAHKTGDATNPSSTSLSSQSISASALGLESVLESFPSLGGFGKAADADSLTAASTSESMSFNPNSVNVIKFDARADSSGSKAALVAIAQDFFDLDAESKEAEANDRMTMDDLLGNFDIPDE